MATTLQLGEIEADVVQKDIKNVHLSVYPPTGRVHISAPERMSLDTIRVFAVSKLDWIRRQQAKLREQERETPREYLDRESHYVWGRRHLLSLVERDKAPAVMVQHGRLVLTVRPGAEVSTRESLISRWYREQVRAAIPHLISTWTPMVGVQPERIFVRQMKTMWGSCNQATGTIRLNTELAKKPRECLEYVVVHEMTHLIEPTHNERFVALMDAFMPQWQTIRERLNRLPVRHAEWSY
jgi:predicted metal-dependent hydrolase